MKLTPDEQIDICVRMMVQGEWGGAKSQKALAAEWDCHPRTVSDRATAASAVVRRAGGPIEDWILGKLAELEHIKSVAMSRDPPLVKTAVDAIRLQMEVRGVFVKKTQELPGDEIDKMTAEEKLAAHEAAALELRAQIATNGKAVH